MEIKRFECAVDGYHGTYYIPQTFAERFPEWLNDEEREILLAGPEHELYWETWDEVISREYEEQSLYLGEADGVFITNSPLNADLQAWAAGEYLENCPKWLRETVAKLSEEFITDRPDEFVSEEEALETFKPSKYNTYAESQALQWMHAELTERM